MNIDLNKIIEYSISSIIGGLFTVVGVYITIGYYRKKDAQDQKNKAFENRPNLDLVEDRDIEPTLEMIVLPFQTVKLDGKYIDVTYHKSYLKKGKLDYFDYTFRNVGKSEITCIHFIMNQKTWGSITELDDDIYSKFINEGFVSYYVILDKRIHVNEEFKVRFYHRKQKALGGTFSAILSISLHDDNDRIWGQSFFYPQNKLYSSVRYNQFGSFYEDIKPKNLVDYFKD